MKIAYSCDEKILYQIMQLINKVTVDAYRKHNLSEQLPIRCTRHFLFHMKH